MRIHTYISDVRRIGGSQTSRRRDVALQLESFHMHAQAFRSEILGDKVESLLGVEAF